MFIKNLKKFTYVLSTLLYLHIEFQDQIHYSLATTKREIFDRFVRLDLSKILSFLLLFRSCEFDLKIL
jgi:hypothetical protein